MLVYQRVYIYISELGILTLIAYANSISHNQYSIHIPSIFQYSIYIPQGGAP